MTLVSIESDYALNELNALSPPASGRAVNAISALSAISPPASESTAGYERNERNEITIGRPLVDRELRTPGRDLVVVAELHILGTHLNWPELAIRPGVKIVAGEDAWTKFLRYPPPSALAAALEATKSKIEQEYPF